MHWLCTHILILAYSNNARPLTSIKLPVLVNKRTDTAFLPSRPTTTGPRVERDHRSTSDDA